MDTFDKDKRAAQDQATLAEGYLSSRTSEMALLVVGEKLKALVEQIEKGGITPGEVAKTLKTTIDMLGEESPAETRGSHSSLVVTTKERDVLRRRIVAFVLEHRAREGASPAEG
jgi:hypothetical protein